MNIDLTAPLTAHKEITIDAPLARVWKIQTDIENWPEWQPGVTSAKLEGELAVGTVFRWKAAGLNITSTIQVLEPQRQIGWTGNSLGMRAVHMWRFEPQGDSTHVITEESLSGWLARLLRLFSPEFLDNSMERSLQVLKKHVEQG